MPESVAFIAECLQT